MTKKKKMKVRYVNRDNTDLNYENDLEKPNFTFNKCLLGS